jgi:hypothetical protein
MRTIIASDHNAARRHRVAVRLGLEADAATAPR